MLINIILYYVIFIQTNYIVRSWETIISDDARLFIYDFIYNNLPIHYARRIRMMLAGH